MGRMAEQRIVSRRQAVVLLSGRWESRRKGRNQAIDPTNPLDYAQNISDPLSPFADSDKTLRARLTLSSVSLPASLENRAMRARMPTSVRFLCVSSRVMWLQADGGLCPVQVKSKCVRKCLMCLRSLRSPVSAVPAVSPGS